MSIEFSSYDTKNFLCILLLLPGLLDPFIDEFRIGKQICACLCWSSQGIFVGVQ